MIYFRARTSIQNGHPVSETSAEISKSCTLDEICIMLFELEKFKTELMEHSNTIKPELEIRKNRK